MNPDPAPDDERSLASVRNLLWIASTRRWRHCQTVGLQPTPVSLAPWRPQVAHRVHLLREARVAGRVRFFTTSAGSRFWHVLLAEAQGLVLVFSRHGALAAVARFPAPGDPLTWLCPSEGAWF